VIRPDEDALARLDARSTFEFYADGGSADAVAQDPWPLLWRLTARAPSWRHVEAVLSRIGSSQCRIAPRSAPARFCFTGADAALTDCWRVRAFTVDELGHLGLVPPSRARLLAYTLLISRIAEVAPVSTAPPMRARLPSLGFGAASLAASAPTGGPTTDPAAGHPSAAAAGAEAPAGGSRFRSGTLAATRLTPASDPAPRQDSTYDRSRKA
jgi:hypothetical protein